MFSLKKLYVRCAAGLQALMLCACSLHTDGSAALDNEVYVEAGTEEEMGQTGGDDTRPEDGSPADEPATDPGVGSPVADDDTDRPRPPPSSEPRLPVPSDAGVPDDADTDTSGDDDSDPTDAGDEHSDPGEEEEDDD